LPGFAVFPAAREHAGIQQNALRVLAMATAYDFTARDIDGHERALREFDGQVLLIVNVASKCGFTPQYQGLEALWRKHRERGFSVLGFPCDQFGHQEPGDEAEIKQFCALTYDVTFPLFAKVEVNGAGTHALYRWLKAEQPGVLGTEAIKWNFTKFLVDRAGRAVRRYAPNDTPATIDESLEPMLAAPPRD
jgi:glutathione peroxidase